MSVKHYTGIDLVGSRARHVGDPVETDDAATKGWTALLLDSFVPTPRAGSATASGTAVVDSDDYDAFNLTLTGDTTVIVSGSPRDHQKLMLRITDSGTPCQVSWNPAPRDSGVARALTVTAGGKVHHVGLGYDSTAGQWWCLAVDKAGG